MTLQFNRKKGLIVFVFVCIVAGITIAILQPWRSSGSAKQNRLQVVASQPNAKSVVTTNDNGDIGLTSILDVGVPRGTIVAYNSSVAPPGWALCDGTNGTPDLRGRFILGAGTGNSLTARTLGDKGGVEKVALSTEEMPPHVHAAKWRNISYLDGPWTLSSLTSMDAVSQMPVGPVTEKTFENGMYPAGGVALSGQSLTKPEHFSTVPHENMPPFYVFTYIMKI